MSVENQVVPDNFTPSEDDENSVSTDSEIFESVSSDMPNSESNISVSVDAESWSKYCQDTASSVKNRDMLFNNLLDAFYSDYTGRAADKRIMKKIFCYLILCIFSLMLLSIILLPLILMRFNMLNTSTFIASMLSSFASIISAVLTLPQVIAKYLFDPQEDEKFLDLIKNMQEYNTLGHERLDHHNNGNL